MKKRSLFRVEGTQFFNVNSGVCQGCALLSASLNSAFVRFLTRALWNFDNVEVGSVGSITDRSPDATNRCPRKTFLFKHFFVDENHGTMESGLRWSGDVVWAKCL